ncbi:metallophosphoesterase [Novosphingobium panipatense]
MVFSRSVDRPRRQAGKGSAQEFSTASAPPGSVAGPPRGSDLRIRNGLCPISATAILHGNTMLNTIRKILGRADNRQVPSTPPGERVYAVGDIHGRADLFEQLITAIERDDAERGPAQTTVVLLGDLIDRGQDSAAVVRRARNWGARRRVEYIQGNHEEMLLVSGRTWRPCAASSSLAARKRYCPMVSTKTCCARRTGRRRSG